MAWILITLGVALPFVVLIFLAEGGAELIGDWLRARETRKILRQYKKAGKKETAWRKPTCPRCPYSGPKGNFCPKCGWQFISNLDLETELVLRRAALRARDVVTK